MKKGMITTLSILGGLLLLGIIAYFLIPGVVIVPPEKVAILVPVVTPPVSGPAVLFVGVTTVPLDLATNQGVINNIVVTFSQAMDPATINLDTFTVRGPNNAVVNGVYTSDSTKKIWTFNPTDTLAFSTLYNMVITTAAKSVSGEALVKNFLWSFTTQIGGGSSSSGGSGGGSGGSTPAPALTLTSIVLTPITTVLNTTSKQQLTSVGKDQNGATIAATIVYASNDTNIATVNASGYVSAVAAGNAKITATSGAVTNTSTISVVSAGAACPAVLQSQVGLLTAANYAIFAGTGISSTGATNIIGDIGVGNGVTSTAITGNFALVVDATNDFATSTLVTGKVYAADYTGGQPGSNGLTPAKVLQGISDVGTDYSTIGAITACVTELGAGNIGGMTLAPGVYKWSTGVTIPTDLTLSGSASDIWVFEISQTLDLASATKVKLAGGALAKNVYWVVTGITTLASTSTMNGNIISGPGTSTIRFITGATLNGRALSGTDVTLQADAVTKPV